LRQNEDFHATLELLGYPTPEPLRRRWYAGGELRTDPARILREGYKPDAQASAPPASLDDASGVSAENVDWDEEVVLARQACDESDDDAENVLRLAEATDLVKVSGTKLAVQGISHVTYSSFSVPDNLIFFHRIRRSGSRIG